MFPHWLNTRNIEHQYEFYNRLVRDLSAINTSFPDQYYGHFLSPSASAILLIAICIKSYTISHMTKTLKPIYWEGSSKSDLLAFPDDAKQAAGYQLHRL